MSEVRVRLAGYDDALVVAALRLQSARAEGAASEPAFLDRFAAAWDPGLHPTWLAELDESHAGVLITQVVRDLPWPGIAPGERLHVATLFAVAGGSDRRAAVRTALTDAMTSYARGRGLALSASGVL